MGGCCVGELAYSGDSTCSLVFSDLVTFCWDAVSPFSDDLWRLDARMGPSTLIWARLEPLIKGKSPGVRSFHAMAAVGTSTLYLFGGCIVAPGECLYVCVALIS